MTDALTNTNPKRTMLGLVLGGCVVLGAMGLITWQALGIERRERQAQAMAQFHESLRLALWRIDSAMTPIIAREAARPYFEYLPFYPTEPTAMQVPGDSAVDKKDMAAADEVDAADSDSGVGSGEQMLVPSPLLSNNDEMVKLHFQVEPDGTFNSPQAPQGKYRELAEAGYVTPYAVTQVQERLVQLEQQIALAGAGGTPMQVLGSGRGRAGSTEQLERPGAAMAGPLQAQSSENEYNVRRDLVNKTNEQYSQQAVEQASRQQRAANLKGEQSRAGGRPASDDPGASDDAETKKQNPSGTARAPTAEDKLHKEAATGGGAPEGDVPSEPATLATELPEAATSGSGLEAGKNEAAGAALWPAGEVIVQGQFTPRWLENDGAAPELVFVRQVRVGDRTLEQGFWLDWPKLEATLLDPVRPLFPECEIQPVSEGGEGGVEGSRPTSRLLATIPAELVVSAPVLAGGSARDGTPWTPLRSALVVGWLLVGVSLVAFFVVARASIELAERRGRFVSAVTHELRTPLTTFCLYSQMLSDGMVGDEDTKRLYARTLHSESLRLARIVESVLDFARLGRGKEQSVSRSETTLADLRSRVEPALRAAADRCGMLLDVSSDGNESSSIRTDASLVERTLANLVDNACKYAAGASDNRIMLRWTLEGGRLLVRVRDFGPGIPRDEARRVFAAFVRGRAHAHGGAPGLGLGLALSSELAARLGGGLRLVECAGGAEFLLDVPVA